MGLKNLSIDSEYRTTSINIVKSFYIPILKEAVCYQRAVGFFSSSSLVQLLEGIDCLVKRNGKIQLIASPKLSDEDIEAISKGYKDRVGVIQRILSLEFDELLENRDKKSLAILSKLIELEILDIRIAFLEKNNKIGMFHEKLGLMYDKDGDYIAFSGSLNESITAYSYNAECIDVYKSWSINDKERAESKKAAFERMWNNLEEGIEIIDFPKVIITRLKNVRSEYENKNGEIEMVEDINLDLISQGKAPNDFPRVPKGLIVRDYQSSAVDNWRFNDFKGIFDMATGTGKTITGILALNDLLIRKKRLAVVIVAPYTHLVEQWVKDLYWFNIKPIIGYSDAKYADYRSKLKNEVIDFNLGINDFLCFITTNASFRIDSVMKLINDLPNESLIIVDEAHNFGSERLLFSLPKNFKYRLALSATIDRHNDPEGTKSLYEYFGGKCIEYTLEKAIKEKKLSPYYYYPIVVHLSVDELTEYTKMSHELVKHLREVENRLVLDDIGKMILLKRARLIASASNKIRFLVKEISKYKNDDGILIYCGATNMLNDEIDKAEIRQIDLISRTIYKNFRMVSSQFTANEDRETREKIINMFVEKKVQAVVAIKCLDEGVNIPSIKTAFILASSTNPKEHIQRRGRVLRLSENKTYADIYDFIVLPREVNHAISLAEDEKKIDYGLVKRELKRLNEFSKLAINSSSGFKVVQEILNVYPAIKWSEINNYNEMEEIE